jgi:nucleotide-binding universal stress UspA family protein
MKRILVASDLTVRSDRALQRALALAVKFQAELKVVHVIDETLASSVAAKHLEAARAALTAQINAAGGHDGAIVSQEVITGVDYRDIAALAQEWGADLLVLGVHRHQTRDLFKGTTSERVVRYGACPVLIVKDSVAGPYRSVLAASDLSSHSLAAVRMAARLVPGGNVSIVFAAHRPFNAFLSRASQDEMIRSQHSCFKAEIGALTKQLADELGDAAPEFTFIMTEGEIETVMRRLALELKPDLIATGTHGRAAFAQAIIGSVAESLLAETPCDVLAVKAPLSGGA